MRIAQIRALGVTPAGLAYLAKLAAPGKAAQRGTEATKLFAQGYVELVEVNNGHPPGAMKFRSWHEWAITNAGREIVQRARAMGW